MEQIISSSYLSSSGFAALNFPKLFLSAKHRTRSKQDLSISTLPKFNIIAKYKERRSADYHPTIWDSKLIQSFTTPFSYERYAVRLEELKGEAKKLLKSAKDDPCFQLKLIDSMQRLGVAYHFEEEIEEAVIGLVDPHCSGDLYTTALQFRLLRERGFLVSSDVFDKFRSRNGEFLDSLSGDAEGLLSLYEASHLGMDGENVLDEAQEFSTEHLKSILGRLESDHLAEQIQKSLEIPLYWRMPRIEARNFIDFYQNDADHSSVLLELAKLDYNLAQSEYQRELVELSKWWSDMDFKKKLSFSRDRLMENYLWALGIVFDPQSSKCRIGLTKFVCILTAIDDIYDVYGSLDELQSFTDAVERWDVMAMKDLPEYMKICYSAMFNFGNKMATDVLSDHGLNALPYIKNEWANLCRSYMVEARWFYSKHTPTLNEYLRNAWTSVGGPGAMVHAYFLQSCSSTEISPHFIKSCSQLFYWSSIITRLNDDLGTSKAEMERGDVAKSIQCYMMKEDVCEEEAREHIKGLISYCWKKLNEEVAQKSLPKSIVNLTLNMARSAQCIFQHGDGIGTSNGVTKHHLISLIVKPISIT